jgi:pyridoxal phosphate enzyme (YggS family)
MNSSSDIGARLNEVRTDISRACADAGRSADDVTLIVVTKFHPSSLVRELYELGVRDVGENRHQEAAEKSSELADLDLTWHFIGQLQSNKARAVLEYADVIHSIDRASLVSALDRAWHDRRETGRARPPVPAFVQVNLTDDPNRGGVGLEGLEKFAEDVAALDSIDLQGVMAVAPLDTDPNQAFERVARASEVVRSVVPRARFISAGMSHDFVEAIAHGATHLRIGSAITGNRPADG